MSTAKAAWPRRRTVGRRGRAWGQGDDVDVLRVDGRSSARLWAGAYHHGAYRSDDGGRTWRAIQGLPNSDRLVVRDIAIAPAGGGAVYLATDSALYRSVDDGQRWTTLAVPVPRTVKKPLYVGLAISPAQSTRIYAQTQYAGTYTSTRAPLDPRQPVAIGVDAPTRRAFVVGAGLVYTLDLDRDTLARTTRTSNTMDHPSTSPTLAILAGDTRVGHVFVANAANGTVSMLDARRSRLLHTGTTIDSPESLAVGDRHRHYDRVDAARARPNPRRTAGVWCILRT